MKILSLAGARPHCIKEALLNAAVRERGAWNHVLVDLGQQHDAAMAAVFFEELGIPEPQHPPRTGSGSHAAMTTAVLVGMERRSTANVPTSFPLPHAGAPPWQGVPHPASPISSPALWPCARPSCDMHPHKMAQPRSRAMHAIPASLYLAPIPPSAHQ